MRFKKKKKKINFFLPIQPKAIHFSNFLFPYRRVPKYRIYFRKLCLPGEYAKRSVLRWD